LSVNFADAGTTTTYTGTGALLDVTWSQANDAFRGQVTTIHSNSWGAGTNPSPTLPAENDDIPISGLHTNASITTNPGLFDGSVGDGIRELHNGGFNLLYGVQIRQTGGTIFDTSLTMRGGAKDGLGGSLSTESIFEIDDAAALTPLRANLEISGQLTMWNQNGAGHTNTFSVLNGWADIGTLAVTGTHTADINILNGRLDVGSFTNANATINMLADGTGEVNLDQADDNTSGVAGNDYLGTMVLNFEYGSLASFNITSLLGGADAGDYWADNFSVGDVKIDGVNVASLAALQAAFNITDHGLNGTTISLRPKGTVFRFR
jgi:hypothetical protein